MPNLRVDDNHEHSKEKFDCIPNLTDLLVDKTLGKLQSDGVFVYPEVMNDSKDLDDKQYVLRSENDKLWTSNAVGFLGFGNERLTITSRFARDGTNNNDHFFWYMMEKVFDMPNVLSQQTDASREDQLLNLLMFLFPLYLERALRKGIYREYVRRECNDANVKASLNIARHIKENTPFLGRIAYTQREHTADNAVTELIRHTIEFLKTKPLGRRIIGRVKAECSQIVEVTGNYRQHDRRKVIIANKKQPVRHTFYHEYRELQQLCIAILQHEKHLIGSGQKQIHGVLFDCAWLWEEYIAKVTRWTHYGMGNRSGTESSPLQLFTTGNSPRYPDFVVGANVPIDTKYKLNLDTRNDYNQLVTYMHILKSPWGAFLQPEIAKVENADGQNIAKEHIGTLNGYGSDMHTMKFPIPQCDDYNIFKKQMEALEDELVSEA